MSIISLIFGVGAPVFSNWIQPAFATSSVTVWFPWSQGDTTPFKAAIARFEAKNPDLRIIAKYGITFDKSLAAINAGKAPDISFDFGVDNVARYCASNTWINLNPYLGGKSGFKINDVFPRSTTVDLTYKSDTCALPLTTDAFALFYNQALFNKAGISAAPKNTDQLLEDSIKLTKFNADGSIKTAGFVPWMGYYCCGWGASTVAKIWNAKWYESPEQTALSSDPNWQTAFSWIQNFIARVYGNGNFMKGETKLLKFVAGAGDEWGCSQDLQSGRTAMTIDGEWRVGYICQSDPKHNVAALNYDVAPFPTSTSNSVAYGSGLVGGIVTGISKGAPNPSGAWRFLKYLTTDTQSLIEIANQLHTIPSTTAALKSKQFKFDPHLRTFVQIVQNPGSGYKAPSVIGRQDEDLINQLMTKLQMGQSPNVKKAVEDTSSQINSAIKMSN